MRNRRWGPAVKPSDDEIRDRLRNVERLAPSWNTQLLGCAGCDQRRWCSGAYVHGEIRFWVCASCRKVAGFEP